VPQLCTEALLQASFPSKLAGLHRANKPWVPEVSWHTSGDTSTSSNLGLLPCAVQEREQVRYQEERQLEEQRAQVRLLGRECVPPRPAGTASVLTAAAA